MATTAPHSSHSPLRELAVLAATACMVCAPFARESHSDSHSAPAAIDQLVEADPDIASRDLFYGVGGRARAPDPDAAYRFIERKWKGTNPNVVVADPSGRIWNAKLGREAQSEVTASRLLWAIGFHQPPVYYVGKWSIASGRETGVQRHARFRLEKPGWKKAGTWDWQDNPFVGTRELRGLVVLMVMLNSWDLKSSNNRIYENPGGDPARLFVVKDLGETLGASVRLFLGTESRLVDFNREGFIRGVKDGRVDFYYRPIILNLSVDDDITVDDVLWTCRRLDRLSDRQWQDLFRAGGYSEDEGAEFAHRLQAKVREGLALEGAQT